MPAPAPAAAAPSAAVSSQAILQAEKLRFAFDEAQRFGPFELHLHEAELLWLRGANGSGKTSLLRAFAGLLPFRGILSLFGQAPFHFEAKAKRFFVPDASILFDDLSLSENANLYTLAYNAAEQLPRILEHFEHFGLAESVTRTPLLFSTGMRQKAALSIGLGLERPLLLLDEPLRGLDSDSVQYLLQCLGEYTDSGRSVILAEHQEVMAALPNHREQRL
jgi:ABC-type multidrug transport system ATPase subunit